MLILTRKPNESIVINDNVVIKILSVMGNKIRIGIEAPEHINIVRDEVLRRDEKVA